MLPRIAALHLAYLQLLALLLLLQRLEKALHTATYHSVETEPVAAKVTQHV